MNSPGGAMTIEKAARASAESAGAAGLRALAEDLERWAVLPSVIYPRNLEDFLGGPRRIGTLASLPLDRAEAVLAEVTAHGQFALVNIDTCPGFGRDDTALSHLVQLGAAGVLSTRLATIQRARQLGLVAIQIMFVTDRSAVAKGLAAVRSATPHLVQFMPAPVLGHLTAAQRSSLGRFFVSGFVQHADDVAAARALGAVGASSSSSELWQLKRGRA